jgi:NAD(P)-dependent dehydrogenase (short-subunit alcohol dehydrogenase family)
MSDYKPFVPSGTLQDKVVFIAGASQGIGLVAAHGFALAGAKVVLGARRGELVQQAASAIEAAGGEALGIALDVTDEDSVKAAIDATTGRFGRIDGLFNNAGIDPITHGGIAEIPLDEWRRIHAVKIDGTFLCTKHAVLAMKQGGNGGAIVNNGSCVSELAPSMVPAPTSSQSAILGITRSTAAAYGPDNIRTNMIATGLIMTPERVTGYYANQDDRIKKFAPMRRAGTAEDIAQVAAWLLSDYSAYVNGAIIAVDGGYLAGTNPN